MKLVPGAKKVGDPCTNRVLETRVLSSVIMLTESERVRMLPRINENHRKGSAAPRVHKTTHHQYLPLTGTQELVGRGHPMF